MKALLLAAALLLAQRPSSSLTSDVEVVGPPSPALWRVTKGRGELWILPAPLALPRGLEWNQRRLEGALAHARVLITPSAYRLDMERQPRGHEAPALEDRLPASVRDRFLQAVAELGESPDAFRRLKPLVAAGRLRDDAWRIEGLDPAQPDATVEFLALRAGAAVRRAADYRVRIDVGEAALSDAQGARCVDDAVDDVADIRQHAVQAARAWAVGDVRAWLAQSREARVAACLDVTPAFAALKSRNLGDVSAAAERALAAGGKSVLLTSPDLLLRPGGLLDRLRANGAEIAAPASDR